MKINITKIICWALIILLNSNTICFALQSTFNPYINQMKFQDYVELNDNKEYKKELVNNLLNTVTVNNNINPSPIIYKKHEKIGKFIRVAQWDIDMNINTKNIENVFINPQKLVELSKINYENKPKILKKEKKKAKKHHTIFKTFEEIEKQILSEASALKESDVIVVNNIEIGMPRTNYKNNPRELAQKLGYNYVFVPEFIEVDPATMGLEKYEWSEGSALKESGAIKEYKVDKNKYKGVIGTAIFSRLPLKNIRVIPLKNVYDWYEQEKNSGNVIENSFRIYAKKVYKEEVLRHIRIGRRIAILADIKLPQDTVTIVATQIERRTRPNERAKQMKELLANLKAIENPVIMAGNLNTSTYNHRPKTAKGFIKDIFTDGDSFIQSVGAVLSLAGAPIMAIGFGVKIALSSYDLSRRASDPTVISIPFFSPNREKKMFNALKRFRFEDGYAFDFRGNKKTSFNNSRRLFSSSNERALKGYVSTYKTKRNLGISNFKLSWIMSKAYNKKPNKTKYTTEKMAPHFGRTLFTLNYEYENPIGMQAPILADFPLYDYNKNKKTEEL